MGHGQSKAKCSTSQGGHTRGSRATDHRLQRAMRAHSRAIHKGATDNRRQGDAAPTTGGGARDGHRPRTTEGNERHHGARTRGPRWGPRTTEGKVWHPPAPPLRNYRAPCIYQPAPLGASGSEVPRGTAVLLVLLVVVLFLVLSLVSSLLPLQSCLPYSAYWGPAPKQKHPGWGVPQPPGRSGLP